MNGEFRQRDTDPYQQRRQALLSGRRTLRHRSAGIRCSVGEMAALGRTATTQLRARGLCLVDLERPLTDGELLDFGACLGRIQPERSPDVQPHVSRGVILNVATMFPSTTVAARQPFAANWLSLHSESSAAPVTAQPRYIVLMCQEAFGPATAKTVLVSMAEVCARLSGPDRALLAELRYADIADAAPLLRTEAGRPVFSLRDYQDDPLRWCYVGDDVVDPADIRALLVRVYDAMYSAAGTGLSWHAGLLAVIDNTVFFHGRTVAAAPVAGSHRRLKRLRIASIDGRR